MMGSLKSTTPGYGRWFGGGGREAVHTGEMELSTAIGGGVGYLMR